MEVGTRTELLGVTSLVEGTALVGETSLVEGTTLVESISLVKATSLVEGTPLVGGTSNDVEISAEGNELTELEPGVLTTTPVVATTVEGWGVCVCSIASLVTVGVDTDGLTTELLGVG